ncbi:tetratricopeptide repeat protein [Streptomyces sp. NPDC003710]
MKRTVYVVSDQHDKDRLLELVTPLREAGFTIVDNEAVGVGDSLIGTATRYLSSGVPVVLCATVHAVAHKWSRKLVNAAHSIEDSKVFVVEMDPGLDLDALSLGTVHARYHDNPAGALADLITALDRHFPRDSSPPLITPSHSSVEFMDQLTTSTTPSIEALVEFRSQLRTDIAERYPQSLNYWEFLQRTCLVRGDRLTRVGVLIVGENPVEFMPSAVIECCEYHGTDRTSASTKTNIFGNLQHQIVEANKYIADRVQRGEAPTPYGPYAEPVYGYPMIAVREIVANAVAHRDYSVGSSCIHVRLFTDRIEITNPGTWTGRDLGSGEPLRINRLAGESTRRNFRLASMLTWIRLVEGEGKGILAVMADCERTGAPVPTVRESGGIITVTVFPRSALDGGAGLVTAQSNSLSESLPPRVTDVTAAPGVINLPHRTPSFYGRHHELATLDEALTGLHMGPAVVHGLGGVGKSTLAAAYADRHRNSVNPVWWIAADSPESLKSGLAHLAMALLPGGIAHLPLESQAGWAIAWLAAHDGWLLILDNVEDQANIAPLLARIPNGRVIVTSRRATGWHHVSASTIRLDVLDPAQAIELLGVIVETPPQDDWLDSAEQLCAELGYLPLAIEQAGAYLRECRLSPRAYLALLRQWPGHVMDVTSVGTAPERSMARIWQLTLDRLSDTPLPGHLLRVLSWYGSESIPASLLDGFAEPLHVRQAIGRLAAYSMVSVDTESISVHPLVQALARTPDNFDPHRKSGDIDAAHEQAVEALRNAIPEDWQDPATWPAWRSLIPHLKALVDHTPPERDTAATLSLLSDAGHFLRNQGSVYMAVTYAERALSGSERLFGATHPQTLDRRNDLAGAHRAAGNFGEAVPLLESTLADYEHVLGTDHPDTLAARSNLAGAYWAVGILGRAISLYEQVVADRRRILGDTHPSTLASRNNLAGIYQDSGHLGRAVPLLESTLADYEHVLGTDHPDTLAARSNLARAYEAQGDFRRAIKFYERALATRERILGPDHPETMAVLNNLAGVYEARGQFRRAIEFYERALDTRRRILGPDHPDTMASVNNLARAREGGGDLARAVPLYEGSLRDHERILGPDHPDTMAVRTNLAGAYRATGDRGRAIPLYRRAFLDCIRVLGRDHPRSQEVRHLIPPELGSLVLADRAATVLTADSSPSDRTRLLPLLRTALPDDAPLLRLNERGASGTSPEAYLHVVEAVAAAIDSDADFADRLRHLLEQPAGEGVTVSASGERSIAIGGNIAGTVVTGDSNTFHRS